MKLRMIVLKEGPTDVQKSRLEYALAGTKGRTETPVSQQLSIEIRDTTANDRRDLTRDKAVIAAAPPMPVNLIRSFKANAKADQEPPKISWGITTVTAESDGPFTGAGVVVAVLDTGIDANHSAFKGVNLIPRNFTTDDKVDDSDGHGTHCAGTIFGRDVDGTRIGIARGVSKALIGKVIGKDGGSTEGIVNAIYWALSNGAQVISMSLGMDYVGYQRALVQKHGLPEEQATALALAGYRDNVRLFDKISAATSSKGVQFNSAIVVAAAGNESNRPNYSITVAPPAAAESFLSVTAIGRGSEGQHEIASFSNEGAMFAAPGVDIWSAQLGGGLTALSGTSMAAPHVAGVAALWAEKLKKGFNAALTIEEMTKKSLNLTPSVALEDARHGLIQAPKK